MRLELGPRDIKEKQCVVVIRHSGEKRTIAEADLVTSLTTILDEIQKALKVKKPTPQFILIVETFICFVLSSLQGSLL